MRAGGGGPAAALSVCSVGVNMRCGSSDMAWSPCHPSLNLIVGRSIVVASPSESARTRSATGAGLVADEDQPRRLDRAPVPARRLAGCCCGTIRVPTNAGRRREWNGFIRLLALGL
ncbi:hypothetical protein Ait01nite_097490 [Actinoplanes italicus]|nr:hypothetical protein Ait01nite_097490 [Actinoplanes italicus]